MQEKNKGSIINQIKGKYSKEELVSKNEFQEYSKDEFEDVTILKSNSVYCLYEAIWKHKSVLFLKVRYFNKTILKNFMVSTSIFNIKSKYLLPRMGYIIDYFTEEFYTIYEKPKGTLFSFEAISHTEESTLLKLYLYDIMAKLIDRLKRNLQDNFKIGLIQPDLFFFNIHDEVPLKMIDFYFFNFLHLSNSDKALNFLRSAFGIYEFDHMQPDDIATMKIILANIFSNEKNVVDINELKNKYFIEINSKIEIIKSSARIPMNEEEKIQLFEKIVKNISKKGIRDLILNFNRDTVNTFYGSDASYNFNLFYMKAFCPMYKKIIGEYKCFTQNCPMTAETILPFCFEALCKKCSKNHRCNAIVFNELYNIYDNLPAFKNKLDLIKDELISIQKAREIDLSGDYMQKDYICQSSIKYNFNIFKKTIKSKQEYLNFMLLHIENSFRTAFNTKISKLEEELIIYNSEDDIYTSKLRNDIEEIEEFLSETRLKFDNISHDLSLYHYLFEMLPCLNNYYEYLDSFYKNYIEFCINDISQSIKKELGKINFTQKVIFDEILKEDGLNDFYFPISGTDLMVRIYDIRLINNMIDSKSVDLKLTFSDKIKNKVIPNDSRYCRVKDTIIITGGSQDDKSKSQLNTTYIINVNRKKVKSRLEMKYTRKCHSMISYNEYFAIAVGGIKNNTCEMYSYLIDNWMELPDLNFERANATLFLFNNYILYCFGGENQGVAIETFDFLERLDLSLINKWKMIDFKLYDEDVNISGINFGIYQKNKNIIIILGGKVFDERDNAFITSDLVYEYNISDNQMRTLDITMERGYYFDHNFIDIGLKDLKFQVSFDDQDMPNLVKFNI